MIELGSINIFDTVTISGIPTKSRRALPARGRGSNRTPSALSKTHHKHDSETLATLYLHCVLNTGPAPNQLMLERDTGVSQSTWSRAFRRGEFWSAVNTKMEGLWQTQSIVDDALKKVEATKSRATRASQENHAYEGDGSEEEMMNRLDKKLRIERLPRNKKIEALLKHRPFSNIKEIEHMSNGDLNDLLLDLLN